MFIVPAENEETIIKDWPVIINVPQSGGAVAKHEVRADFLMLSQEQIDAQIEESRESNGNADIGILNQVLRNLGGFQDASGNKLDYSADMQARVLKIPYVRSAMINTYFEAAAGKKAKRKN